MSRALLASLPLLVLLVPACRVEHGVNQPPGPPDGRAATPPRLQVKQSFDPKSGKLAHEYTQLVFVDRRPVKDGKEVKYSPNGEKTWEGEWKQGRKTGTWRYYYEDGRPKSETFYGDTRTPTTMTFWHPNGRVSLQGPAINGSRQGTWRIWRKSGLLAEEGPFVGSVREGEWKVYSEDGTAVTRIVYSKNVRVSAGAPEACAPVWADATGATGAAGTADPGTPASTAGNAHSSPRR